MKKQQMFLGVCLWVWVAVMRLPCAAEESPLRVGVSGGWGSARLVELFSAEPDIHAVEIRRVTPAVLEPLDVVVVTQRASGLFLTRSAPLIKRWVESGKGILFLHGAVGYRSHIPLFPSIGTGSKAHESGRMKGIASHSLVEGLEPDTFFEPSTYRTFVSIRLGDAGEAVVVSEEGDIAVAAGTAGLGRVVLYGMGAGAAGEFDHHNPVPPEEMVPFRDPAGEEWHLLLQALRWLAGREK